MKREILALKSQNLSLEEGFSVLKGENESKTAKIESLKWDLVKMQELLKDAEGK